MQMTMNEMSAVKPAPQSSPPKVDNKKASSDDKSFQDSLDNKTHVDRENQKAADDQQNGANNAGVYVASTTVPVTDAQQQIAFANEVAKMQADMSQAKSTQQTVEEMTQSLVQINQQVEKPVMDLVQQIQDAATQQQAQTPTTQVKVDVQVNTQASLQLLAQQEAGSKAAADLVMSQVDPNTTATTPAPAEKLVLQVAEKAVPIADTTSEKAVTVAQVQTARPNFLSQLETFKNQIVEAKSTAFMNQVSDNVKTALEAGKDVVKIQMQPENLGKVEVRIVRGSDGVQFFFTADTVSTSRMLQSSLNQLHQSLVDAGVKVGNMSVSYHGQPSQQNNQGQSQRKNGFSFFGQDDSEFNMDYSPQGALTALDAKI